MEITYYFPVTVWVWRRQTSRTARRIGLIIFVILATPILGLRIYTGIFVFQVHRVLGAMEKLRVGQTTEAEMFRLLPGLRIEHGRAGACESEECYSVRISNLGMIYGNPRFQAIQNDTTFRAATALGLHSWTFEAIVSIREGKVHNFQYFLLMENSADEEQVIAVGAGTEHGSIDNVDALDRDESPDYQIQLIAKRHGTGLHVSFSPTVPPSQVHRAFDLHLGCMLKLGCQTAEQVLPLVWNDEEKIHASALARLQSSDPCPDRILFRRARDIPNILFLEVERVQPGVDDYGEPIRTVDYRLLETLKGAPNLPLKGMKCSLNKLFTIDERIPDPLFNWPAPGGRVLRFTDARGRVWPCGIVAATPTAVQTIQSGLASPESREANSHISFWSAR